MIAELLILTFLTFTGVSVDGTIWYPIPTTKIETFKEDIENADIYTETTTTIIPSQYEENTEVYPLLGCPSETVSSEIQKYLAMIPSIYLTTFYESGWTIQVLDYIPGYADNIIGLTDVNKKTISIINNVEYSRYILHEFGHFLEFSNIMTCNVEIYLKEKEALQTSTETNAANVSTMFEFYAEGYMWNILNCELLEKNCPELYAFYRDL